MEPDTLSAVAALWRESGTVARVTVQGGSMVPLLNEGEVVRVRAGGKMRVGDVVVARTAGGMVVHRVIDVHGQVATLRGDDVPTPDAPVDLSAVLGRVIASEGLAGRRLDSPGAEALGRLAVTWGRLLAVLGCRGRPALVMRTVLVLERLILPTPTPEEQFVLLMARLMPSPAAQDRARVLAKNGLAWDRVLARAHLGQVGPLVYQSTLRLGESAGIPQGALDSLRQLYVGNWARSRKLQATLAETLECLAAEGVEVLAHKGVALTVAVYPDPALRISGDLDLSVLDGKRQDAERATQHIRDGLHKADPSRRSGSGLHIELDGTAHHDVDPAHAAGSGRWLASSFDWAGIWAHARPYPCAGHQVLVPDPTDLLLTLIANSIRRGFSPLRLICDIAATIAQLGAEIEWGRLAQVARETRLDRRSWIPLGLAVDWFGAEVPASLLEPPVDLHPSWYERYLLALKQRRPFTRLPTRVLWAGGHRQAAAVATRMVLHRVPGRVARA